MIKGFLRGKFRSSIEWSMNRGELAQHYVGIGLAPLNSDYRGEGRVFPTLASMKKTANAARHIGMLKHLVRVINKVDDDADSTPPDKILDLGNAQVGSVPSDFLKNSMVYKEEYWHVVNKLIAAGLTNEETRYSFSNLASVMIQDRARCEQEYLQTKSVEVRLGVAQANTRLAKVYAASVFEYFHSDPRLKPLVDKGLDFDDINQLYPSLGRMAYFVQIADDLRDFFTDLEYEIKTGVPSPNFILAHLHKEGCLLDANQEIRADLLEFISKNATNTEEIPFSELPDIVLGSIERLGDEYMDQVKGQCHGIQEDVATAFWTAVIKYGLSSSTNTKLLQDKIAEKVRQESSFSAIQQDMKSGKPSDRWCQTNTNYSPKV